MSKSERDGLVQICCDYLGISKIDQDAKNLVEHFNKEFIRRTIILAKKWANRSGRSKLQPSDWTNAVAALQKSEFAKSVFPLLDTFNLDIDNLHPIPGSSNLYAKPNREIEIDPNGKTMGSNNMPIQERIRSYFLVTDGNLSKSAYTLNLSEEDIDDEEDMKPEKFTDHSVKFDTSAIKMYQQSLKTNKNEQIVGLKPNVVESLSMEQQAFMREFLNTSLTADDKKRQEALRSLEKDASLQQMIPHLVQIIQRCITANIAQKCLSLIIYGCRTLRCICINRSIDLSMHLHILLPLLLTCIIGRSEDICIRPESDNHWVLRDYATKTLLLIFKNHIRPEHLPNLKLRVYQYVYNVIRNENSSPAAMFGAVPVLSEFAEYENMESLVHIFSELANKHRDIHNDNIMNPHLQTMALDSLRLHQQIVKYDAIVRTRLDNWKERNCIK